MDREILRIVGNAMVQIAEAMDKPLAPSAAGELIKAPAPPPPSGGALPETTGPGPLCDGEQDSQGTPWDARYHSSGKTKYARATTKGALVLPPGSWQLKRNVDLGEVAIHINDYRSAKQLLRPTFDELSAALTESDIGAEELQEVLKVAGVGSFPELKGVPEAIAVVFNEFKKMGVL